MTRLPIPAASFTNNSRKTTLLKKKFKIMIRFEKKLAIKKSKKPFTSTITTNAIIAR